LKDQRTLLLIQESLGRLALDPFSHIMNIKKLRFSRQGTFRLRCGSWRVLFDVDTRNKIIIVYRIMQRKEGY
jgi:mRNA-degrading endonuclease RelE of RelBE toxin-antitoxin system